MIALQENHVERWKAKQRERNAERRRADFAESQQKRLCESEQQRIAEIVKDAIDTPERDPQTMSQHRDRIGRPFDAIGMAEVRR